MTLALTLARFICGLTLETLPEEVVEKARACVLNGYGIALGSHTTDFFPVAARAALTLEGTRDDGATLLRDGRKTTPGGAAFANAALFHGRAQEDTCGVAHFGAILLPLLTALVEAGQGRMEDVLPALIAGYEAGGLFEAAYAAETTAAGLRATPLYGTLAAAAATARLWRLDDTHTAAALANAAAFSGGILQSFGDGTDEWRYQVGAAARNGLMSAALAAQGSVSAAHAFEGAAGFVRAFVRRDCDVAALEARLGRDWAVLRVAFKPYPVCALNQTPVIAALDMKARLGADADALRSVTVHLNPTVVGYAGMDTRGPFQSVSGTLMSIQFCVATTLIHGAPTIARMQDFDDAAVHRLMARITPRADPALGLLACRLEAEFEDSRAPCVVERKVDHAAYSFGRDEVAALVRRIGEETGVPAQAYDRLERFAATLPHADLSDVLAAFRQVQRPV